LCVSPTVTSSFVFVSSQPSFLLPTHGGVNVVDVVVVVVDVIVVDVVVVRRRAVSVVAIIVIVVLRAIAIALAVVVCCGVAIVVVVVYRAVSTPMSIGRRQKKVGSVGLGFRVWPGSLGRVMDQTAVL
jgi:hypothetical protein